MRIIDIMRRVSWNFWAALCPVYIYWFRKEASFRCYAVFSLLGHYRLNLYCTFSCWMDTGNSIWFLGILVIVVMTVNLIFVVNVIRVIKRKRTLEGGGGQGQGHSTTGQHGATTMKAARAALMLVPILGLHFILLPIRPSQGSTLEYIYEVVSALSSNFQGFLVSLLFCFLNSEVRLIKPLLDFG